jgi:queuine tRNA-ribosyltransferase
MNFDIYGLGGWPVDTTGQFDYDFCQQNAELTAADSLRFALGVGTPLNIVKLFLMGYQLFDCVLPTRDARHQRLYVWRVNPQELTLEKIRQAAAEDKLDELFDYLYIGKSRYATDQQPLSPYTETSTVSRAYLHHLFKIKDSSAMRLASLHNLRMYTQLMEVLRRE